MSAQTAVLGKASMSSWEGVRLLLDCLFSADLRRKGKEAACHDERSERRTRSGAEGTALKVRFSLVAYHLR